MHRRIRRFALVALHYGLHLLPATVLQMYGLTIEERAGTGPHLLLIAATLPAWLAQALWMVSAVVFATAVRWLWEDGGALRRTCALTLSLVTTLASVLMMISLLTQGTALNVQFFFHADWETMVVAANTLAGLFVALWAYWLVAGLWPCLLPRVARPRFGTSKALAIGALGMTLNGPLLALVWYVAAETAAGRQALLVPKPAKAVLVSAAGAAAPHPHDLILIIAESLEATYSNSELLGSDLTPRLTALAKTGLRFTDVRQVPFAGWTTGALVASHCAFRLGPSAHGTTLLKPFSFDVRLARATCLGDVLAAHGYRTVYMGGARLSFAGKGRFLAAHGFAERYGLATLAPLLDDPDYVSGWGLYDDSLLTLTLDKLTELAQHEQPFALALLTLDTHAPEDIASASCGAPEQDTSRASSVRCADRLIADFIATIRQRFPDAVIVLFSDHLARFNSVMHPRLHPFAAQRRLRFVAWAPHHPPGTVERRGTHFDVGLTVLDLLGIAGQAELNLGTSLLRGDSPWLAHPQRHTLRVVHGLPELRLRGGDKITFDPAGPTIEVGDLRMLATGQGLRLHQTVFAIARDAQGRSDDIRHFHGTDAVPAFTAWAGQRLVLGVSTHPTFNQQTLGVSSAMALFVGTLDVAGGATEPAFLARPLLTRETVAVPHKVPRQQHR